MNNVKEAYKSYLDGAEGATKYNRFKEILYGVPDSNVLRIFDVLRPELSGTDIRILDVGGGDGRRLRLLMALLRVSGIRATSELVEPSRTFTDNLKRELAVRRAEDDIRVTHQLFEDYASDQTFDLILLLHSIFTFKDSSYVETIIKHLNPNGLLFIAANAEDSFLAGYKQITDAQANGTRKEIRSVLSDLAAKGFQTDVRESLTYFSDCLEAGELNDDGMLLLEWLALVPRDKLSDEIVQRATDYVRAQSSEGRIAEKELYVLARR